MLLARATACRARAPCVHLNGAFANTGHLCVCVCVCVCACACARACVHVCVASCGWRPEA
jgi:hypothetical protein